MWIKYEGIGTIKFCIYIPIGTLYYNVHNKLQYILNY